MATVATAKRRGRPSKGDRHAILAKLPRPLADVVIDEAQRRGISYGDMVVYLVACGLGYDVPEPGCVDDAQEELPVQQSA